MENRAQGSIEYLLLIGAVILVAAIVIVLLGGITSSTENKVHSALHKFFHQAGV